MKAEEKELPLATRLACLKSSFKSRKSEKWTDKEILVGFDELIIYAKNLESQLEERNYRYCPYCSHLLSHRVDTDANTKLVCKYALCPTKTQNQTKYV